MVALYDLLGSIDIGGAEAYVLEAGFAATAAGDAAGDAAGFASAGLVAAACSLGDFAAGADPGLLHAAESVMAVARAGNAARSRRRRGCATFVAPDARVALLIATHCLQKSLEHIRLR